MKSSIYPVLIILAVLCAFAVSGAPDPVANKPVPADGLTPATGEATPGLSLLTMSEEQAHSLTPMNREIRALLIRERDAIAALTTSLEGVKDQMEAIQLQKKIGYHKARTEIDIMEVQAKYAAQAGRHEQATEIKQALTGMKARLDVRLGEVGVDR